MRMEKTRHHRLRQHRRHGNQAFGDLRPTTIFVPDRILHPAWPAIYDTNDPDATASEIETETETETSISIQANGRRASLTLRHLHLRQHSSNLTEMVSRHLPGCIRYHS